MSARGQSAILAIDCSQRRSHLAFARGAECLSCAFEGAEQRDREPFWDELRALLAEVRATPADVDAVAVAVGPGGFTGLRVATSFAKGFALARSVPIIAIPSAVVFTVSDEARGGRGPWLVALAAKGETAWCTVVTRGADAALTTSEPQVVGIAEFSALTAQIHAACAGGASDGHGTLLADEHLSRALVEVAVNARLEPRSLEVDARAFASEAARRLAAGATTDPLLLAPIYAREPEAVTKWRERAVSARRDA